ncbi:hypothetical protein F5887DRAFT_917827 [Amanita rubescens]|nr:hypothetical protein F5887DRAFT_917827 [Amanita rubescens]
MPDTSKLRSKAGIPAVTILDPQEVLDYIESRFRAQWNEMIVTDLEQGQAIVTGMNLELHMALLWIGICAATGRLVNVPVLIRQLSFYLQSGQPDDWNRLMCPLDFLLSLDAGNHPSYSTGIIATYVQDWWTKDWESHPTLKDVLNTDNIYEAVMAHREECAKSKLRPNAEVPKPLLVPPSLQTNCLSCHHYRLTAMEAINDLEGLRNRVQALESELENQSRLMAHCASGFIGLHEEALRKEALNPSESYVATMRTPTAPATPAYDPGPSASDPAPLPDAPRRSQRARRPAEITPGPENNRKRPTKKEFTKRQLIELLHEHYDAEHRRLEQHPSLKWTWGVDVLESDISNMFRAADREYELPHSGYDCSLTGYDSGETSFEASSPVTVASEFHSALNSDYPNVPELASEDIPHHFLKPPLCSYRSPATSAHLPNIAEHSSSSHASIGSSSRDSMVDALYGPQLPENNKHGSSHAGIGSSSSRDSMVDALDEPVVTAWREDSLSDDSMIKALGADQPKAHPEDGYSMIRALGDIGSRTIATTLASDASDDSMLRALDAGRTSKLHTADYGSHISDDSMINALGDNESSGPYAANDDRSSTSEDSMLSALYGNEASDRPAADVNDADSMLNAIRGNAHRQQHSLVASSIDEFLGALTQSSPALRSVDNFLTPLEEDHSQFLIIEDSDSEDAPVKLAKNC